MLLTFKITLLARAELSVEVPDTLSWSSWQQAARFRHKITKMVKTKTQITPANIAIRVICKEMVVVVQVGCEFPTRHDYFQWHKCRVQSLSQ